MNRFDIYLIGVGGQGIGLLSETLIRAADNAGLPVSGVDTHGLAQRGGMVVSHVRLGSTLTSPLVRRGRADLVIALERTEAYRALFSHARRGGTMVCYDTSWQTLKARLGEEKEITRKDLEEECSKKDITLYMVRMEELEDYRMQNMVILGEIASRSLIPSIKIKDYEKAMEDLMGGVMLEKNLTLFRQMTD
jgi:indolepyruvate ferredoxin oxidoreductase beta subunit